jgi:hypothetical protein
VNCQWLTKQDEERAKSAQIIRLIVDDQRGDCDAWANDVYQRHFLREVQEFIGPTNAVLVTDAGSIKAYIPSLPATIDGLRSGLTALGTTLSRIDIGQMEMLLGVDGCIGGQATHLKTVVHLRGQREVSLQNTTIKLYPTGDESESLIGWHLCHAQGRVPDELAEARRVQTSVGTILVLVCNDAAIFSARSLSNLRDPLKLLIRRHFLDQASNEPKPAYILLATHWNSSRTGEAFRQAARYLDEKTGATVIATMRTTRDDLESAARRFAIIGPQAEKVATLLVTDTLRQ